MCVHAESAAVVVSPAPSSSGNLAVVAVVVVAVVLLAFIILVVAIICFIYWYRNHYMERKSLYSQEHYTGLASRGPATSTSIPMTPSYADPVPDEWGKEKEAEMESELTPASIAPVECEQMDVSVAVLHDTLLFCVCVCLVMNVLLFVCSARPYEASVCRVLQGSCSQQAQ